MRTRTVELESFRDENTGELGFAIKGMRRDETTNASMGQGIAHDLLEHINGPDKIGDIADEMEALGALYYVRGQFGRLSSKGQGSMHTITQNIASDITRMFRDHVDGGQWVDYGAPTTRAGQDSDDADLQQILIDADGDYTGEFDTEGKAAARREWPRYRRECLNRLRIGYRKARRKYPDATAVNRTFWEIERVIDRAGTPDYEGAQYILTYGPDRVYLEENYGEDYT